MKKNSTIKKLSALIISVLLLTLSMQFGLFSFLIFFAFIPLVWLSSQSNLIIFSTLSFAVSAISLLISDYFFLKPVYNYSYLPIFIIQSLMLSIPWWGYHFIKIRHNQKLAYWMLACSWLSIEWLAGQFWMSWNGFQLGIILSDIDVFVQCYDLIGISGGSLWIIILNIQIFRLLFSEKEKPIKGNLINLAFIFFIPIMLSVYLLYFGKTIEKDGNAIKVLAQNVVANAQDCNPDEEKLSEKKLNPAVLKTYPCDIIALETTRDEEDFKISASFKSKSDSSFNPIQSKTLRTNDIFGISKKELTVLELAHLKINAIGSFQVIRSEFFRLNCKSNQNLIICCSTALQKPTFTLLKIARLRAIENRKNIILFDSNNNVYGFQPSGKTTKLKIENATFETDKTSTSFYGQYGDLAGRLSLFISAWLLLGTFTKTDRNNFK